MGNKTISITYSLYWTFSLGLSCPSLFARASDFTSLVEDVHIWTWGCLWLLIVVSIINTQWTNYSSIQGWYIYSSNEEKILKILQEEIILIQCHYMLGTVLKSPYVLNHLLTVKILWGRDSYHQHLGMRQLHHRKLQTCLRMSGQYTVVWKFNMMVLLWYIILV